jgi:hypothetical protein
MSSAHRRIARERALKSALAADRATAVVVDADEGAPPGGLVTIAVVSDVKGLLDARLRGLHGDVIDALVELVVDLLDEEGVHGEGQDR